MSTWADEDGAHLHHHNDIHGVRSPEKPPSKAINSSPPSRSASAATTTVTLPQSTTTIVPPAGFTPIDIGIVGASKHKKKRAADHHPPQKCTTTSTITRTLTSTTTGLPSSTSTVTVQPSPATYYAACGPSNIATQYNNGTGNGAVNLATVQVNGTVQSIEGVSSQYDCCVRCITTPLCGASNTYADGSTCFLFFVNADTDGDATTPAVCDGSQVIGTFGTYRNGIAAVSNGLCAQLRHDPASDYYGP